MQTIASDVESRFYVKMTNLVKRRSRKFVVENRDNANEFHSIFFFASTASNAQV